MPQTALRMRRDHADDLPPWRFADGFAVRGMEREDIGLWVDIWRDADPTCRLDHAGFRKDFGQDWDDIRERCLLIEAPGGVAVATASAWREADGSDVGRVHWVGVRAAWQGRGLAKPLMAEVMRRLAARHPRMMLDTHAHRLGAIALYLRCGFAPDRAYQQTSAVWDQVLAALATLADGRGRAPHPG